MKRTFMGILALIMVLFTLGFLRGIKPAIAQNEPTGSITVWYSAQKEELNGKPVMISIINNGAVIKQTEKNLSFAQGFDQLPVGTYEVRCEGEGMVTVVKRGILVLAKSATEVQCHMTSGQGVHVVEYATGALSREEIAARLSKLEAAVEELKKKQ